MVKRLKEILMWAGKVGSIDFVVIHNDAGGSSWTGQAYIDWLRDRNKALGIAHFYITKDDIAQVLEIGDIGYHTGEWWSNTHSIGYEICNSHDQYGVDNDTFKLNEEMCLRKVAEDMKALGLPVNRNTVRLHREFVPTSCPNRSWALHGQDVNAVKDYFISRIKYYMALGDTVEEMLQNTQKTKIEKEVKEMIDTAYAIQLLEDLGNRKKDEIYLVNVGARTFTLQNKDTWNTIKDVFPEIKVLKATKAVNYLHASVQAWGLKETK